MLRCVHADLVRCGRVGVQHGDLKMGGRAGLQHEQHSTRGGESGVRYAPDHVLSIVLLVILNGAELREPVVKRALASPLHRRSHSLAPCATSTARD